jgi:hypothetical protein
MLHEGLSYDTCNTNNSNKFKHDRQHVDCKDIKSKNHHAQHAVLTTNLSNANLSNHPAQQLQPTQHEAGTDVVRRVGRWKLLK